MIEFHGNAATPNDVAGSRAAEPKRAKFEKHILSDMTAAAARSLCHAVTPGQLTASTTSSFTAMTFRDRHGGEQGRQVEIRVDKDLPIIALLGLPSSAVLDLVYSAWRVAWHAW